ncbi:MAG: single-stranded DNA-binding protein [Candidatus Sericytochromatia bacterium]
MAANNQVVLIGRAGNNVAEDVRHLQSGTMVAEVRLAVNRPTKDASGNPVTDWITCQFWDKNAERLSEFVKKGDLISVSGAMRVDNWEKEGEKRSKVYVHGENFQMLESRSAREQRQQSEGGSYGGGSSYGQSSGGGSYGGGNRQASHTPAPARSAPAPKQNDDFGDEFALDDDELPPF